MSHEWAKALLATLVLTLLVWAALGVNDWRAGAAPAEDMAELTEALFTTYVVPFEVLSVLLLGALFGALYVGAKMRKEAGP